MARAWYDPLGILGTGGDDVKERPAGTAERGNTVGEYLEILRRLKEAGQDQNYVSTRNAMVEQFGDEARNALLEADLAPALRMSPEEAQSWASDKSFMEARRYATESMSALQGLGPKLSEEFIQNQIRREQEQLSAGAFGNIGRTRESMAGRGLGRSGAMSEYENMIRDQLARETASSAQSQRLSAQQENWQAELDRQKQMWQTGGQYLADLYAGREFQGGGHGVTTYGELPYIPTGSAPSAPAPTVPLEPPAPTGAAITTKAPAGVSTLKRKPIDLKRKSFTSNIMRR